MARRREKSPLEALALMPWWVSVVLAGAVYIGCQLAPSFIHTDKPVFAGLNAFVQLLPDLAHWPALLFLFIAGVAAIKGFQRRRLLESQSDIESVRNLSWQEFELLVGEAFRRQGYSVEENGGGGADGGVDLRLRRDGKTYLVQCKRWKTRQVGVSPVRELFGLVAAEAANGGFFVSSGAFTGEAERFAIDNGLTLVDGHALEKLIHELRKTTSPNDGRATEGGAVPLCPKCGGGMVLRSARRGSQVDKKFWGCDAFPTCRGTRHISAVRPGAWT